MTGRAAIDYSDRALIRTGFQGLDVGSDPIPGFYKTKLVKEGVWCGIEIWHGPPVCFHTGEMLDRSWRWQAEVNGFENIPAERVWPNCYPDTITEEEYLIFCQRQNWAQVHMPKSANANPFRKNPPISSPLKF